jgi:hypothetical protein
MPISRTVRPRVTPRFVLRVAAALVPLAFTVFVLVLAFQERKVARAPIPTRPFAPGAPPPTPRQKPVPPEDDTLALAIAGGIPLVFAVILAWPFLRDALLLAKGATAKGVITEVHPWAFQGRGLGMNLRYEYRELEPLGTERIPGRAQLVGWPLVRKPVRFAVGDVLTVYYSRWNPARHVVEPFALFRVAAQEGRTL